MPSPYAPARSVSGIASSGKRHHQLLKPENWTGSELLFICLDVHSVPKTCHLHSPNRSCIHPLPPAPLDSVTITLWAPLTSPASSPAAPLRAFSGAAQACAERAAQACADRAARNPLPFQALAPCCPLVREHLHPATAYSFGCQLRCYHEAPLAPPPPIHFCVLQDNLPHCRSSVNMY